MGSADRLTPDFIGTVLFLRPRWKASFPATEKIKPAAIAAGLLFVGTTGFDNGL
jgi:hypothetical protein